MSVDPITVVAGVMSGLGAVADLAGKLLIVPDPAVVLTEMRERLAKMQAQLGEGGAVEKALVAHNATLDEAIKAEKRRQGAPNPTVLIDPRSVVEPDEDTKP